MSSTITVKQARQEKSVGQTGTLQGWVRTRRDSKAGFSFIELNDGSSQGNIQIIADKDLPNYADEIQKLTIGCSISVVGVVQESGGKGQKTEVQAESVSVLGWADPETYPLQKKGMAFETCLLYTSPSPRDQRGSRMPSSA